jgi:hypothetical protein
MKIPLLIAALFAALSAVVLIADALAARREHRLRRHRGLVGAVGAVVDSDGHVLGIYNDPFADPGTLARVHHEDSPWTELTAEGRRGWAWEGFGQTAEEAVEVANALRRRHLKRFPWLTGGEPEDEDDRPEVWRGE